MAPINQQACLGPSSPKAPPPQLTPLHVPEAGLEGRMAMVLTYFIAIQAQYLLNEGTPCFCVHPGMLQLANQSTPLLQLPTPATAAQLRRSYPEFRAPEQLAGRHPPTTHSLVFSLGQLLLHFLRPALVVPAVSMEGLAGEAGRLDEAVLGAVHRVWGCRGGLPTPLATIIRAMMQGDPQARMPMDQVLQALHDLITHPASQPPAPPTEQHHTPPSALGWDALHDHLHARLDTQLGAEQQAQPATLNLAPGRQGAMQREARAGVKQAGQLLVGVRRTWAQGGHVGSAAGHVELPVSGAGTPPACEGGLGAHECGTSGHVALSSSGAGSPPTYEGGLEVHGGSQGAGVQAPLLARCLYPALRAEPVERLPNPHPRTETPPSSASTGATSAATPRLLDASPARAPAAPSRLAQPPMCPLELSPTNNC